jgi:hypothetical protein
MVSRSFWVEFLGLWIMLSTNRDTFTISLPICIPSVSSSCLISLSRNSRTMLNRSGESRHPSLVPEFRRSGVESYQRLFLHLLRLSCGFCLCFY